MFLAANAAVLGLAGCWHAPATHSVSPSPAPGVPMAFVGDATCANCHSSEFASHHGSRHAQTFHEMRRSSLGALAPPLGRIDHTGIFLGRKGDEYALAVPSQTDSVAPLQYALGSGKTGMTYVSLVEGEKLVEFRMSYFPHQHGWYVTPGQESLSGDELGKVHPPDDGRACLSCHIVTLPTRTLKPEKHFFGVGCEACHGPGNAHVAAMQAGQYAHSQMDNLKDWPASRLNNLCGKCHGTAQDVQAKHLPRTMTNRLQPYGLMLSQCYLQSKDTLSCVTCHDPHTNVSTNTKHYEAVCLTCHSAAPPVKPLPQVQRVQGQVCPVNAKTGCINCHMPERPAIPGSALPTMMADHFIRKRP